MQIILYSTLILVPYILFIMLSFKVYKYIVNPVSIYCTMWLLFTFFASQGILGVYKPSLETIFYILVSTLFFCIISFVTFLSINKEKFNRLKYHIPRKKNVYFLLIIVNLAAIIWLIPFVSKTLPLILDGQWELVRFYYLNASTTDVIFNTHQALINLWVILPIFYVTSIISAYLVTHKKGSMLLIIFSTLGILLEVIATAGRNALFKCFLFYIIAFLINSKRLKEIFRKIKESSLFVKVLMVLAIAIIVYISTQRSLSDDIGALQNAFYYFLGPIIYFDYIIQNPEQFGLKEDLLFGKATLGFISTPLEIGQSILFGKDYVGADNVITSYVSQYVNFTSSIKGNAVSTSLYPFMKDFGLLGLVIGPTIYAFIVNYVYANYKKNIFWGCLTIYMLYTVLFSEWQYELLFPQSFTMIVLLYIFVGNRLVKL